MQVGCPLFLSFRRLVCFLVSPFRSLESTFLPLMGVQQVSTEVVFQIFFFAGMVGFVCFWDADDLTDSIANLLPICIRLFAKTVRVGVQVWRCVAARLFVSSQ